MAWVAAVARVSSVALELLHVLGAAKKKKGKKEEKCYLSTGLSTNVS